VRPAVALASSSSSSTLASAQESQRPIIAKSTPPILRVRDLVTRFPFETSADQTRYKLVIEPRMADPSSR
jgi:hypothetical protein